MATVHNNKKSNRIPIISASKIINKISAVLQKAPEEKALSPLFSDEDHQRELARQQAQKAIEKARNNVLSFGRF